MDINVPVRLGGQIRNGRDLARLTQKQLAAAVGLSAQYICDIEVGNRLPPPATLQRIADELGEKVDCCVLFWQWFREQAGKEMAQRVAQRLRENQP